MGPPPPRMTRARAAIAAGYDQPGDEHTGAASRVPPTPMVEKPVTSKKPRKPLPKKTVTFKEPRKGRPRRGARASAEDGCNPDSGDDLSGAVVAKGGHPTSAGKQPGRPAGRAAERASEALQSCYGMQYMSGSDEFQQRKVKIVTEQNVVDKPSPMIEFPMREWSAKIFMVDDQGNEHPADCFNKVVYNLHPSFEQPVQTFTRPPFTCENEGWGEFEMDIDCYYTEKTKLTLKHDLNFQQNKYEVVQSVSFKNPSQALQEKLRELGPLPDDDARPKKKGVAGKKTSSQKYDFEKIAEALEKLEEDDLLKIIQMINDYKSPDTYIKSDVEVDTLLEAGEFSIDLYTMPDVLTKMLWEHLSRKGLIS